MSIVFPSNPTLGQTYTYSNITWEYNGFAWNKLTYIPDPLYIEHLNVDFIDFDTTVVGITQQDGRMYWDSNLKTVVLGMTGGINTAIGQSLYKYVHNGSGGPINKGQVVYISGGHASTSLNIELANALSEVTAATTIGVAAENIANGADGFIITQGLLTGIDTNAYSPADEGKLIWLAETNGGFTITRPQAPSHGVVVGWLVKKAGAGAGSIFVKITNGQEFEELHDVRITGATTDDIPAYNGASAIWVNKNASNLHFSSGITLNGNLRFADGTTQDTAYRVHYASNAIISDSSNDILIARIGQFNPTISNTAKFGPTGSNMMLLMPYSFPRGGTVTKISTMNGDTPTGNTGSFYVVIYDCAKNGLPLNKVYNSSIVNMNTTAFSRYTVNPNVFIPAGLYWIGMMLSIPSGKTSVQYSFAVNTNVAGSWDALANGGRFFNNGSLSHLRYRYSGFTLENIITSGFTSAVSHDATTGSVPAIGWGCSEMFAGQREPYFGVNISQ